MAEKYKKMENMSSCILGFQEINRTTPLVGGKGANLGELSRIADVHVPEGFCITTEAYEKIIEDNEVLSSLLDQLTILKPENRKGISDACAKIRKVIEAIAIPKDIEHEIIRHLEQLGDSYAYAIRSSATAEDLPTASFAGQQDTYLNVIGKEAILQQIRQCWASLASG